MTRHVTRKAIAGFSATVGRDRSTYRERRKHVRIFQKQMGCAAWRDLSGSAVKVLLAMGLFENGENNGEFFCGERSLAEMTGLSRNTVRRSLRELIEHDFIYCSERGSFDRKVRHAACYGFTWLEGPKGKHRAPSHAYEQWIGNSRAQFPMETGAISDTAMETPAATGSNSDPSDLETPQVSVDPQCADLEPQTVSQGIGFERLETAQRKQANPLSGAFPSALRTAAIELIERGGIGAQSKLADRIGCPPGTFSKFIGGRNLPEPYRAPLAAIVGVNAA